VSGECTARALLTIGQSFSRSLEGRTLAAGIGRKIQGTAVNIVAKRVAAVAAVTIVTFSSVDTSWAGGGDVAAGLIGGLAAGAIIGAATAPRHYYYGPPVAYPPPPAYVVPGPAYAPACYWAEGEPFWNGYAWVPRHVQVCQ
jgi:hypothetical protein